jgi:phosphoglycerol transferase MdoB-like AlkP superfamily enzyme
MTTELISQPRWWQRLGLFLPLLGIATFLFLLLSLSRLGHTLTYAERVRASADWGWLFLVGLRMDSVLISFILTLPALVLLTFPATWKNAARRFVIGYGTVVLVGVLFMEIATVRFLEEFDHRPDRLFWEYLNHPKEVLTTVIKSAWGSLIAAAIVLPLAAWGIVRWCRWLADNMTWWSLSRRLILFPIIGLVLAMGIRGTLSHRPVNISTAAFSNENLLNQLALNSTYTATYALYALRHEADSADVYGKMDADKVIAIARRATGYPETAFTSQIPLLRPIVNNTPRSRPHNLVIIIQESMGAQFVGCLGGLPLTPEIDALSKEGLLFTKLYATGTRTVRGIEAIVSGFPPSPARSVVKLGLSQNGFFTVAQVLGRHNYESFFFYGGESHFDNMRSFFQGNDFARIVDQPQFDKPEFLGVWGVSDGDLARRAASDLAKQKEQQPDKPFVAVMLSTSNHEPFEFPDGHIDLYEQPKQTRHNAIKYSDWAVGEFFRQARQLPYFSDTIFLVVADHNIRTTGDSLIPVGAFRIPGFIIGPGFTPGTYDRICSQLDLLPTILPRLGVGSDKPLQHPLIGHDLLSLPADAPGRAIMQFADAHGYRIGNRLVVHQPREPARRFIVDENDRCIPTDEAWAELTEEALAHALLPSLLYRQRKHTVP